MVEGFRILELSLKDFLNGEINIDFFTDKKQISTDSFSCALIIGENGCGKTELLVNILKVFSELEKYIKDKKILRAKKGIRFNIKYYLNGHTYEISTEKDNDIFLKINEKQINDISKIEIPTGFIAQSFSFADKFNYYSEGRYSYLGTRTASNASYISHIENSIVEIICTRLSKDGFIEFINVLFEEYLHFDKKIEITYQIKSNEGFTKLLDNIGEFEYKFNEMIVSEKRMNSYIQRSLSNKNIEWIYERIRSLRGKYLFSGKKITYSIELNKEIDFEELNDFFVFMRLLSYMRILSIPKISFYKHSSDLPIESASSGERQIIYSLLSIYSVITPNSLIVIDEPEISLHPLWQIKYMNLLEKAFNKFTNSQFVIATHSHFMVSDLKKQNSSIIVMSRSAQRVKAERYKSDTHSWSAEDILYNVFAVPSTRNFYIATEVETVINAIAIGNITDEIKLKIENFKKIFPNLKEIDPLKTIITKILERNLV